MVKDKLVEYRSRNNYSIEDLSKKLNVSSEDIVSYEEGKETPPIEFIYELCKLYDIPLDNLLSKYEREYIYKLKKKKISSDTIVLIICIIGISIPTIIGTIFFIQMIINWINGGTFF